jgi:RNase adaptor protein for sRNA GlmZ degradation
MKKPRKSYLMMLPFLLVVMVLNACKNELTPDQYVSWVENPGNKYLKKKQCDNYIFELKYLPNPYRMIKNNMDLTSESLEQMENLYYFQLEIIPVRSALDLISLAGGNEKATRERKDYFQFGLEKDIRMIQGKKKVEASFFHMENTYNMKNSRVFHLAFELEEPSNNKVGIEIDSRIIGNTHFIFKLRNEPKIVL